MINTHVKLPGLDLKNPVMPASGTFGFGDVPAAKKFDLNDLGAMVIKTTTPHATTGNPQPQIAVLDTGVLNSVGLTNPGVDAVIKDKLAPLRQSYPALPIMASVGGEDETGYVEVAQKLSDSGLVNALEINVSCPNVNQGGMSFGVHPDVVESLTKKIKAVTNVPIYVKLTPNVTDIVEIAVAAQDAGADALTLINSLGPGMKINIDVARPVLSNKFGGMSGKAIKPIALRNVYTVYDNVDIPIIGVGGISNFEDVVEFLFAGARAVQIGTSIMDEGVEVFGKINKDLEEFMNKKGYESIDEMIGLAHEEL